ncbi:hypothetical protein E9840_02310 [Tissierella creatinini]|nr:hypothetical protein E9840_02310 [Tissierella creatinini]TJX63915.1 hypothetical protein E8P77_13720 [Soehngenia saccharolytica]
MTKTNITSNILENISNKLSSQGFSKAQGKALVVINGTRDFNPTYGFIQDLKNSYEISIGFSFMAERILDTKKIIDEIRPAHIFREEDILRLREILRDYTTLVGPNISMNTLAKVYTGMIDSFISNIIWSFLYFGKEVYLDFTSVREFMGQKPKNEEMEKIIENHISTLIKMGAVEIKPQGLLKDIVHPIVNWEKQKDLISEKDILKLNKNQVLVLDKKTLITPLARDKARELGIKIEKK